MSMDKAKLEQDTYGKGIAAVKNNEMGWMMAPKKFGVSQATLSRRALNKNKTLDPNTKGMGRYKTVSTDDMERELTHVEASLDDKVLLVVDGHISHKGIESFTLAKEHGIILLCLRHFAPIVCNR
ncbi:hypothetical protein JTB14_028128 [Gonioctena quinquepunctata]|nr:hypothetical protein JTB14_028128 [Gonioctena quinquepunctata]